MKNIKENETHLCKTEKQDLKYGFVGYVTIDFHEEEGNPIGLLYPVNPLLNTEKFRQDCNGFIYYLQKSRDFPLLENKFSKEKILSLCPDMKPFENEPEDFGFSASDKEYKYYVRCPADNSHEAIVYCYQKSNLLNLGIIEEDFICEDDNKRL